MTSLTDLDHCTDADFLRLYQQWFADRHLPYVYNLWIVMAYIECLEHVVALNREGYR